MKKNYEQPLTMTVRPTVLLTMMASSGGGGGGTGGGGGKLGGSAKANLGSMSGSSGSW